MIWAGIWEEMQIGVCKMEQDNFSGYHPVIAFIYFIFVITVSMFVMHPVFLALSLLGGTVYYIYLKRKKALKLIIWLLFPVLILSTLLNPLFNHEGATILGYFKTGNPLTLESILYGLASGVMIVSVLNWFSCYQYVMTSDKFIYLFGKIIPAMSLIFSMVLRFVPKFKAQIQKVSDSQKCIGRDVTNGNALQRGKHGMKILSVMITWALENSVETADSMRSRGYGLRGRNNFSIYRFDSRDMRLMGTMVILGGLVFSGLLFKKVTILYYPLLLMNQLNISAAVSYTAYGIFCFLPFILDVMEDIKWHYLRSGI